MTDTDDRTNVSAAADHLDQAADLFASSHQHVDGYSHDTRELLTACWRAEAASLRQHLAQQQAADHG